VLKLKIPATLEIIRDCGSEGGSLKYLTFSECRLSRGDRNTLISTTDHILVSFTVLHDRMFPLDDSWLFVRA
jgi:hypothetical protein